MGPYLLRKQSNETGGGHNRFSLFSRGLLSILLWLCHVKIRVERMSALHAEAMAEGNIGVLFEVGINLAPVSLVIAYLLA